MTIVDHKLILQNISYLTPFLIKPAPLLGPEGNYEASPEYFNRTGNQTFPNVSPSGNLKLHKGIYCLENGISLNGNWNITTDLKYSSERS